MEKADCTDTTHTSKQCRAKQFKFSVEVSSFLYDRPTKSGTAIAVPAVLIALGMYTDLIG